MYSMLFIDNQPCRHLSVSVDVCLGCLKNKKGGIDPPKLYVVDCYAILYFPRSFQLLNSR